MGDSSFTIQISSNLVRHLVDDGEKSKKKPKTPKQPKIPQREKKNKVSDEVQRPPSAAAAAAAASGWPIHQSPPLYLPPPILNPPPQSTNDEVDAILSVLEESKKVMDSLKKQEDKMVKEVTERAKELHDKEFKLPIRQTMPCLEEKDACLNCYKENVKDPLKCALLVKDFAECARKVRQQQGSDNSVH